MPLVVLSAAAGLDASGVSMLNSALPSMGMGFGTSTQSLSWAVTGYALAFAGLVLCGGAMTDRLRRRQVLVAGLAMIGLGDVLAIVAPTFWTAVAGRVLQGVGAAITMPATTALLTSVYHRDPMRSRALGVFSSAQAGCFAAGLILGGVITSALGWRWVFALHVVVAAFTAAAAVRWLPIGMPRHRQPLDPTGAGALVTAITLMILAANMASRRFDLVGLLLAAGMLTAATAMGSLWWWRSRICDTKALLLNRALLRIQSVRRAAVVAGSFFFCGTGSLFLLPVYLQQTHGLSPAASGLAILPVSLAVTSAALASGRLMKTRGPRMLLILGVALTSAGVFLWCTVGANSPYAGAILAGLIVTGIGQGLAFPALTAVGLQEVPADAHGMASAITITALQAGGAIGPTVLAGIAQSIAPARDCGLTLAGYHLGFAIAASTSLCVAIPAVIGLQIGSSAQPVWPAADAGRPHDRRRAVSEARLVPSMRQFGT
ncbi:Methyl viologen resistance protein SmvA [Mycobacterium simulans]|uniref:Methyl viologen resistance protein SmvA n=1 Tax=Mycobacterium simulans TaxID=627089 RepID=A0A7Z7INW2_9MYCO|nr:MFS transporter [Mycobacterium simulans]SOJ55871.1 Methyl viologen resistance protein SmvA [Mycobacterium simulans]